MTGDLVTTMRSRLTAAADDVESAREAYDLALARRDELIVEARDVADMPYGQIAQALRLARSRVMQVLARV